MRFAVLHHTGWPGRPDHYDLLLQIAEGRSDDDQVLKAFATTADEFPLGAGSAATQGEAGRLRLLPDHRRIYLRFEGPVSGDRGQVRRVDEGELELLRPLEPGLPEVRVRLAGTKLKGVFVLRHQGGGLYSFA